MEVTLAEAARQLGVSPRQAQRLVQNGTLTLVRKVGRSALVDSAAVLALRRIGSVPGRRWDALTAWTAVDLLETGFTDRLAGSTLSRLRGRLRDLDAAGLVLLASRRARTTRLIQTRRQRGALEEELALSGQSLLRGHLPDLRPLDTGHDRSAGAGHGVSEAPAVSVARRLGLAAATADSADATFVAGSPPRTGRCREGYVHASEEAELVHRYGLQVDAEGDVFLHVTQETPKVGWVSLALDLVERGSSREATAGGALLQEILDRFRAGSGAALPFDHPDHRAPTSTSISSGRTARRTTSRIRTGCTGVGGE